MNHAHAPSDLIVSMLRKSREECLEHLHPKRAQPMFPWLRGVYGERHTTHIRQNLSNLPPKGGDGEKFAKKFRVRLETIMFRDQIFCSSVMGFMIPKPVLNCQVTLSKESDGSNLWLCGDGVPQVDSGTG